jgi:tellurite resistance protein
MQFIIIALVIWIVIALVQQASKKGKRTPSRQTQEPESGTVQVSIRTDWRGGEDVAFRPTKSDADCWIPENLAVEIRGRNIPGGMIYVGEGLGSVRGYGPEPALINPKLSVSAAASCIEEHGMSYWPSYYTITPQARAAYLDWLSLGRRVPNAYIGYVFLFFYGLERRVLHAKCSNAEMLGIRDELIALREVYGNNHSFRRYAEGFLGLLNYLAGETQHTPETNLNRIARGIYPSSFKIALGTVVSRGNGIPWDLALEWVLRDDETRLRVPAKRCPEELAKLFKHHYDATFGEGLNVSPNKTMILLEYHSASSSLGGYRASLDLPDPTALTGPLKRLRSIVDQCMNELDAYSRLKGKDPEAARGVAGYALLPQEVAKDSASQGLGKLKEFCTGALDGDESGRAPVNGLIALWPTKVPGKMNKSEAAQVAGLLASFGIGMEPDPRYGGRTPSAGEDVILFRFPGGADEAPGTGYYQAQALVHLTGLVSTADGEVSSEEREALGLYLASSLGLSRHETTRMKAFFKWVTDRPASFAGLKAKLGGLSTVQRSKIAEFLISVAGADGVIHPKEIRVLERIYGAMGMVPSDLQTHLHRLLAHDEAQPVTVRSADASASGFAIPAPHVASGDAPIRLDLNSLREKREQTKEVAKLLEGVFAEEEPEEEQHASVEDRALGLDAQHRDLLKQLATQGQWERDAFESLVVNIGLMPSGVLEMLNEIALDNFDDQVLFDEDKIEVNRDVIEEMLAA